MVRETVAEKAPKCGEKHKPTDSERWAKPKSDNPQNIHVWTRHHDTSGNQWQGKVLQAAREKWRVTYRWALNRETTAASSEATGARGTSEGRVWNCLSWILSRGSCPPGRPRTFSDEGKQLSLKTCFWRWGRGNSSNRQEVISEESMLHQEGGEKERENRSTGSQSRCPPPRGSSKSYVVIETKVVILVLSSRPNYGVDSWKGTCVFAISLPQHAWCITDFVPLCYDFHYLLVSSVYCKPMAIEIGWSWRRDRQI